MIRGKILVTLLVLSILLGASALPIYHHQALIQPCSAGEILIEGDSPLHMGSLLSSLPEAIQVADTNHFFPLIATPLAVHYSAQGIQKLIPLYVVNEDAPSKAVIRAQDALDTPVTTVINSSVTPKQASMELALTYWENSSAVLLLESSYVGYELGIVAVPLASYLSIPVLVTDEVDAEITSVLDALGVEYVYICGDLHTLLPETIFSSMEEILGFCVHVVETRFSHTPAYITMANPMDYLQPEVLDSVSYPFEEQVVGSSVNLPTQALHSLLKRNTAVTHTFAVPQDYKNARIIIDLENKNIEHVDDLGDRMFIMILSPENGYQYAYASTGGGLAERNEQGEVTHDILHYEFIVYDEPGDYTAMVLGHWFAATEGEYDLTITVEKLSTATVPLMKHISCMAPYLTAYHQGIVFGRGGFEFAASDEVMYNGTTCPGVSQPGTNPNLIVPSNEHTMDIHDELNGLLADLADITISGDDLSELQAYYREHPVYIAIMADPTMIPMYFYYNPDGDPNGVYHIMGYAVPSDFIYGDIDPKEGDAENNTYTYWPFQENVVGRVTGRDVQDLSALLARTFFYEDLLEDLGNWKNNALVQTGCGLEFQNLPFFTRLNQLLYSGRGEPTKFPTGESSFINARLKSDMETGEFTVTSTRWLQSQLEGFSEDALTAMKQTGLLSRLLFPKMVLQAMNSEEKVTGGEDQMNSNLIFTFAHGFYYLFESGDILLGCRGIPFITALARIYPQAGSRLSDRGTFDVRALDVMDYGPSVVFIESCITARTDGINPENTMSQAYLHAGANTYIGATRVTADPGYLDPRPGPGGLGFGILGYLNATLRYRLHGEFPDLHFGAVIAEDFILDLIDNDQTTGMALRNAKNQFLPKDANSTFLWSPPLTIATGNHQVDTLIYNQLNTQQNDIGELTRVLDKKYVALHEFTLYGDPAFNPYQPVNTG